jgi:excisionase family DNA binding protein
MQSFYTTFEAARLLGVSLPTVVNWIKGRRLKAHRTPGGHRRIAREDLAAFMLRHGMPMPGELSGAAPARRKALVIAEPGPVREGTVRQLAAAGFAVEQASPGFAAGATAARFEPDVLVVFASGPDGGESIRGVRSDRELASVPVVALGKAEWAPDLAVAGCAATVAAPLRAGALADAVEGALRAAAPRAGAHDELPPPPPPAPARPRRKR